MFIEKYENISFLTLTEDDLCYILGNYIYNVMQPKDIRDIEKFKYILGKIYFQNIKNEIHRE